MKHHQPPRHADTTTALSTPPAAANDRDRVAFAPIEARTEQPEQAEPLPDPWQARVGIAVVGLGHLAVDEMLPAFARSRHAKPAALVTGDRAKGVEIARHYGIPETAVLGYGDFDRLVSMPDVQGVYIALPNSLHAEYTVRAARAGKHVLCEKPMATSVADCEAMIDACRQAGTKLMIAYRSQFEPLDRELVRMVRDGRLGALKEFVSCNSQNMGDPRHWRLQRALAGGGALPDIGLYCINAARFLSGEEPDEVLGSTWSTPGDARFTEVEESCQFVLRFPSGFMASCTTSYAAHKSQMFRLNGSEAWAEMNPAFAYRGLKLRVARVVDGAEWVSDAGIAERNQFAAEMDHFARCIQRDEDVRTPGEEGLRDQRIMDAIYASARTRAWVKLAPPPV